jgi:hypothetical protein
MGEQGGVRRQAMEHDLRRIERRAMLLVAYGSFAFALALGYGALLLQRTHVFLAGLMIPACVISAAVYGGAKVELRQLTEREERG